MTITEKTSVTDTKLTEEIGTVTCPSSDRNIEFKDKRFWWSGGVRFAPNDQQLLQYLEAKRISELQAFIDECMPTILGENGIWSTHPEKLPGVCKDGQSSYFFHLPSHAYPTRAINRTNVHTDEERERRKVYTDEEGIETRWHKTGKTRAVFSPDGTVKGFKKILVLYNYGRKNEPEKTNWIMHQYHLGSNKKEKDGELVVSKIFYQRQSKQFGSQSVVNSFNNLGNGKTDFTNAIITVGSCYYSSTSEEDS